jgi:tRNA (Thr-GGU) A37 N-methylase
VLKEVLVNALDGVEEFSHLFIIYWMNKISNAERRLVHGEGRAELLYFRTSILLLS